ncbi:Adenosylcobinamide-phosphate synthase [hydrothermal vent metagenome]|uniref:Adenosylcobinamide-phosphate synthase n=1 Tax=hydrothermal vent metagenome TaxID=652676 RepID=A0A3B1DT40_9ZZZZ
MALFIAFLADIFFGDPVYAYHPARLMGKGIERGENFLRKNIVNEKLGGAVLALGLVLAVFLLTGLILYLAWCIHPFLAMAFNIFGIYSALSIKDLYKEAKQICKNLQEKNIELARKNVGRIVGRDTAHLDEKEVVRATVETIAESSVDGIIAPIFYAALGGAPLALAYKAVNTLDSMIGYKNEKYYDFGFFAAKQDDVFNWLPARISYCVISIASLLIGKNFTGSLNWGWKDGVVSGHGNSVISESCFAGALGVQLGGENMYQGKLVRKVFLGKGKHVLEKYIIKESLNLMVMTSCLTLGLAVILRGFIYG